MLLKSDQEKPLFKYSPQVYFFVLYAVWTPFLMHNIVLTKMVVVREAITDRSSGQAIGLYIRSNRQLGNAIIIGSPDNRLQTIGYYTSNRIYIAREKIFRKFVKYAKPYKNTMELSELLETADHLNKRFKVPVLIVLGYFGVDGDSIQTFNNRDRGHFRITPEDLRDFKLRTLKLAEFNNSLGDESYQLFLYDTPEHLEQYSNEYLSFR